ncbi:von Willebrand factor type A domain-containing protein [Pseudobacteriovorax antillogorgiicola]|uniref:von Willebrand factor type A domain-containing protein n=2 Tax=Pseudobacteriovorax antillogorgiicola TaxID=1513793 RepID=A0A1Y6C9V7_9BACT|nr:von Willebrand factor type A domain-containing protein [Pseudobacteriovorax antillogorgiicola]SMF49630.1 von Willebrand factor type A domain-containing protein [Pseudobacteriovorax antillogorgiicola]
MSNSLERGLWSLLLSWILLLVSCHEEVRFNSNGRVQSYDQSLVKEYQFQAGTIRSDSIYFEPKKLSFDHRIVLEQIPNGYAKTFQMVRPIQKEEFIQGGQGRSQKDDFALIESGYLDLLIVIDNSSSMEAFQLQLQKRFKNLLSNISNTNWQIAVATTSSSCLRSALDGTKILKRTDFDISSATAQRRFEQLISAGVNGSTVEKGILTATEALQGDCGDTRFPWTRADSQKAVLIVSDEKNCGSASNEGCVAEEYSSADYFLSRSPRNTRVYGLLLFQDDFAACPNSGGYDNQYPSEYMRLIQETGGLAGEICQADYSEVLETISSHVSKDIKRRFSLTFQPDPGTLKVYLDGELLTDGYVLIGQELRLMITPSLESEMLFVDYTYGRQSMRHYFDLSKPIDPETLEVVVDQEIKSPDDFYIMEGKTVVFRNVPAASSKLKFSYRQDGLLKKTFPLTWPSDALIQSVRVNGNELPVEIDYDRQWLKFNDPPMDGAEVSLEYQQANAKILDYPIPQYQNRHIQSIEIIDAETAEPIDFQIVNSYIKFKPEEVWPGRELVASIQLLPREDDSLFQFTVPPTVIPDSMVVTTLDGEDCADSLDIHNGDVKLSCDESIDGGLAVSYRYIEKYTNQFVVDQEDDPQSIWRVFIDGVEYTKFQRLDGNLIIPPEDLEPGSSVAIQITPPIRVTAVSKKY